MHLPDDYRDLLKYLDELQMFGIKLGLQQTEKLFELSGAPRQQHYLHIAGTNGKGSVGAMLEKGLRGTGFSTGFYSSPHLVDLRERFRINGQAIDEVEFTAAGKIIRAVSETIRRQGGAPTYFEFTTALAALLFQRAEVDFVIWETGMGGQFDATNVVTPELAVITHIDFDHQQYLGDSLTAIAAEKAGIIKPERPVFLARQSPEAARALLERAAREKAAVTQAKETASQAVYRHSAAGLIQEFRHDGRVIRLPLPGAMQRQNFALVYEVLRYLADRYGFELNQALAALESVRWPGRVQELSDRLLLDGGHNPDAAKALAEALQEAYPGEKFAVVFAGFRDKDVRENLRLLSTVAAEFFFAPLAEERPSYRGEELIELLRRDSEIPATAFPDVRSALAAAQRTADRTVATGSLYLVGEILQNFPPELTLNL